MGDPKILADDAHQPEQEAAEQAAAEKATGAGDGPATASAAEHAADDPGNADEELTTDDEG